MKVNEIIAQEKDNFYDFEIWQYTDKTKRLHTDYIKNLDEEYGMDLLGELEADNYYIMDQDEYSETILINCSLEANFAEWYDNASAKILVIMIDYTVEL